MRRRASRAFWQDRCVLVTGHQGFKGAWLCMLLAQLGARTIGFGRDHRDPLLYRDLKISNHHDFEGDINDVEALANVLATYEPEFILHLAAQPIVLESYRKPLDTFRDNVMGTAAVLHAAHSVRSVRSIVVVTSDKVYRNEGSGRAFTEDDPLGGDDPYSASKAAAELVAAAMAKSFFAKSGDARVVTARAGNVIGGGDYAINRLIPDAARAFASNETLVVRNPMATRPWQHVLDPLEAYLLLAEAASDSDPALPSCWNFGPDPSDVRSVRSILEIFTEVWSGDICLSVPGAAMGPRLEAETLAVDSMRAHRHLRWKPSWTVDTAVRRSAAWYRDRASGASAQELVVRDIETFLA